MKSLAPILQSLSACDGEGESIEWAGKRRVSRAAYMACDRGDWPHNGAQRLLVAPECAEAACDNDPDWVAEVQS